MMNGVQKPRAYERPGLPLMLEGPVVEGFGRGSKQLGFPTANLDPGPLQQKLQPLPLGVYWGYADLHMPAQREKHSGSMCHMYNMW